VIITAVILLVIISFAHSYLGEKYILIRLFRKDLPKLFGSDDFTKKTLRFAWHLTSIAWLGFAYALYLIEANSFNEITFLALCSYVFGISAIVSLIASKAKHLSWLVFLMISLACAIAK